jgi:colanic acid biosynthesis glycosyl transferase WcaI
MKILIHDYCGHPFQIHLSRQLAARGHQVWHVYFAENHGPKGFFERVDDPDTLQVIGLRCGPVVDQTKLLARRFHDVAYGRRMASLIRAQKPDVVLSGNTPTDAQRAIIETCKAERIRFVYWLQDVYSMAVSNYLEKKLGPIGKPIGWYYRWLDRSQFHKSDAIIAITDDFVSVATTWGGAPDKVAVIENWAVPDDFPRTPKDNAWSRAHGVTDRFTYLYSGTLGRKHNPTLLSRLAQAWDFDGTVVVVAQGVGMQQLESLPQATQGPFLKLLPLQPAEQFRNVLASADVLVATIERDAGTFAVPSKVLSYLCAGRPILLAAPKENLAARTVIRANAGLVVDPDDGAGFMAAASELRSNPALRARLGAAGRSYAEKTFDLTKITDNFERILVVKR